MNTVLELIQTYLAAEVFPGCEFSVLDGSSVRHFSYGKSAILPAPVLLKPNQHWDLASVSKVVGVGTALINRILAGELNIKRPLSYYYPAWHENTTTVQALITHTSGLDPFIANRDQLDFEGLKAALNHLTVTADKHFHYTDVNFILLGFMLETLEGQDLDKILQREIFDVWQMIETSFGPIAPEKAVPTAFTLPAGTAHDPKARVLGSHCGSAGLFSTLADLERFVQGYFADSSYLQLLKDWTADGQNRSLAWAMRPNGWLLHTGYTGTFILLNLRTQQAVIFLSNRVHLKDERQQWIMDRDRLIEKIITCLIADS